MAETVPTWDADLRDIEAILGKGGHLLDQIYESSVHGAFNAGLFARLYLRHPEKFEAIRVPMDVELVEYIKENVEIDRATLNSITKEQIEYPVFAVTLDEDPPTFLIDGHHRVVRRWELSMPDIAVLIANREITEMVHVVKGPLRMKP